MRRSTIIRHNIIIPQRNIRPAVITLIHIQVNRILLTITIQTTINHITEEVAHMRVSAQNIRHQISQKFPI